MILTEGDRRASSIRAHWQRCQDGGLRPWDMPQCSAGAKAAIAPAFGQQSAPQEFRMSNNHISINHLSPVLIAIDWGSSSFRAYLMSPVAEVLDEVASGDGIGSVAAGAYPATLKRLIGQWLKAHPSLPLIASGMVGSRNGWREAAYVKCPAGPSDVAARLTQVEADGRRVHLAAGPLLCR